MSSWENIIEYYEATSTIPRDGLLWDEVRYHCQEMLKLIPDIRNHPQLQFLEPLVDAKHLRLLNRSNNKIAVLFNINDGTTNITLFHADESLEFDKQIQTETSNVVQALSASLFDT